MALNLRKYFAGPGITQGQTPMPAIQRPGGIQAIRGISSGDWFSPLQPIPSTAPSNLLPRQYQYTPGQNIIFTPRGEEPIDFAQLRGLAESYDLLRIVIETWKDLICTQKLVIRSKPQPGETKAEQSKREAKDTVITQLMNFFDCPDGEHDYPTWLRALLEDQGVIDAATVWIERVARTGKVVGFRPIDGATIVRYIDEQGFTPRAPNQAYAQVLYGQPAVPLTDGGAMPSQAEVEKALKMAKYDAKANTHEVPLTQGDILYLMHNWRTWKLYGYSPVEQAIVTINIALRREIFTLDYYTAGNTPEGFYSLGPQYTIDQVKEFQEWFDSVLAGNLKRKRRIMFMPGGEKGSHQEYVATKEPLLKNELDDYLASFFCFLFGISRQALIKQMNRASAEQSSDSASEEGLKPALLWVKNSITRMIRVLGFPGYYADFEPAREVDVLKQAQADHLVVGPILTQNEAREQRGLDPSTQPEANQLGTFTPNGFVPLGQSANPQADDEDSQGDKSAQVDDSSPKKKVPAAKLSKGWVTVNGAHIFIDESRPQHETGITIKPTTKRAWNGKQIETAAHPSKLETGALGEKVIIEHLKRKGLTDARPLNDAKNNYPVDLVQDHGAVEVKTGLVSNSDTAMHWRATIGQPGKEESAWLKTASSADKKAWNLQKAQAIIDRKNQVVKDLSAKYGAEVKGSTMTTIINPDTRTVDVYEFEGFHSRIAWNSPEAKAGYVGSYNY